MSEILLERLWITSGGRRLDAELAYGDGEPAFAVLLLNPHPHMGGSMDNPLIAGSARELAAAGGVTLRFDYSGVGRSEGTGIDLTQSMARFWETGSAPEDPLMIEDGRAGAECLRQLLPETLVLLGYSFGAFVAASLLDMEPAALVLISPTIARHDFSAVQAYGGPLLVIHSDNDFATPAERMSQWLAGIAPPPQAHLERGAEHFFKGREKDVALRIAGFVRSELRIREAIPCPA